MKTPTTRPTIRKHHRRGLPKRARRGFSLAELIVAMTLLSVGLLALAGMATRVTLTMTNTANRTRAIALAQTRLESLRGLRCGSVVAGSATAPAGGTESWTATAVSGATIPAVTITDTITYRTRTGMKKVGFTTVIPCG